MLYYSTLSYKLYLTLFTLKCKENTAVFTKNTVCFMYDFFKDIFYPFYVFWTVLICVHTDID